MTIPKDILAVARQVRRWCLKKNGVSKNMCSVSSRRLYDRLRKKGYRPKFVSGFFCGSGERYYHCWVRVLGYILDVTADQFGGMPAIMWGKSSQLKGRYEE